MEPIERYLVELSRALRGPKHAKADMLAEARESLHDAVESYMDGGATREAACRLALNDFGSVRVIAPGFQAELSVAQAKRTAIWITLVVVLQPLVWGPLRPSGPAAAAGAAQALIDRLIDGLGVLALAGAVLAWFACGVGTRLFGTRVQIAQITGVFGLSVTTGFVVSAGAMLATVEREELWALAGLPWATIFLMTPMAAIAISARRCLKTEPPAAA